MSKEYNLHMKPLELYPVAEGDPAYPVIIF
jgi:hypothetical protein